jgi:hypothetical protein
MKGTLLSFPYLKTNGGENMDGFNILKEVNRTNRQ